MQRGLAPVTTDCAFGVGILSIQEAAVYRRCTVWRASPLRTLPRGAPGLVGTRGMVAMVPLCKQSRHPLLWTYGRGMRLLPECAPNLRFASAYCTVPAAVLSARAHSCSLSVSASMVPHGSHLTECDWHSLRGAAGPKASSSFTSLSTADRRAPGNESSQHRANTRSLSPLTFISLHTVRILCSPAAFRLRNQQQQSSIVVASQPWEVDAQERSRRARRFAVQAALVGTSMAERDIVLQALRRSSRPRRDGAHTLAGAGGRGAPNGTDRATAAMVSSEHKSARVPRNKQLSTSHHILATTSPNRHQFLALHSATSSRHQWGSIQGQHWVECRPPHTSHSHLLPPSHHHVPFQQQHLSPHNISQMWHRFLVFNSLRLEASKTSISNELIRSAPAPALLNTRKFGGYAGTRVGEAQNPGPATHAREWTVTEQPNATHRRINEAGG